MEAATVTNAKVPASAEEVLRRVVTVPNKLLRRDHLDFSSILRRPIGIEAPAYISCLADMFPAGAVVRTDQGNSRH
jgi:hypothetical protein